jgi:uncharacterized protein DUF6228
VTGRTTTADGSVRLAGESGALVTLRDVRDQDGYGSVTFVVELEDHGLRAESSVSSYESEGNGLAAFLEQLAADWRGWAGTRSWDSHHALAVEARHDGRGNVWLRFTLRSRRSSGGWTASAEVDLAAGQQLGSTAAAVASLLRLPPIRG